MANGDPNQGKVNISIPFDTSSLFGALGGQQQPEGLGVLQPQNLPPNTLTPAVAEKPRVAPSANLPDPPPAQTAPSQLQADLTGQPSAQEILRGSLQDPERQELLAQLNQQFQESQADRRGTIGELESSLARQEAQGPDTALAISNALARFSDAFFDTNIAKSLPQAETAKQRETRLNTLRRAISQEKGSLSREEVNFLKSAIAQSGGGSSELRLLNALRRGEQFQTKRSDEAQKTVFKSQDKIDKDFRADLQQFETLDASLAREDYQSVMATLGQFARAVSGEKGVLTDNDINRVIPRNIQGDAKKVQSYFSGTPSADITPSFVKNLRELVAIAKEKSRTKHIQGIRFLEQRVTNQSRFEPARKDLLFDLGQQRKEMFKLIPKTKAELRKERIQELKNKRGK